MLRDIFIPEMKLALEEWGVQYRFNAADSIFFLDINGVETKIICKSMENYERLVGINAAWIICDEFDTSKKDLAYKAFQKLLGRLRAGNVRQFIITTTPEGYKATYQIFVKEPSESKRLIKAKTTDNKYLPPDFIETLKEMYPENLLRAYLDGDFVNLTSGNVYKYFNRNINGSDEKIIKYEDYYEDLHIGADFNIGGSVNSISVQRGQTFHLVEEMSSYDTREMAYALCEKYGKHRIFIYPDASGDSRKTSASKSDIQILKDTAKERGVFLEVIMDRSNPDIMDSVNAVNNAFEKKRWYVNVKQCPQHTEALEQHSWDEKTGKPEKFKTHPAIDDRTDNFRYKVCKIMPVHRPKFNERTVNELPIKH